MAESLPDRLPILKNATQKEIEEFERYAILKKFKAGEMLSYEGDSCSYFVIVLSGNIRVYKAGISEREITLYRVNPHESCILTAFCILSQTEFPAFAVAETDMEMILIPSPVFREWINRFDIWRNFTFTNLSIRLNEILQTIDKMAFQRVDARVANFLLHSARKGKKDINITHQQLAKEVGSSRVVISRTLETLAQHGLVELGRGVIHIMDEKRLLKLTKNLNIL